MRNNAKPILHYDQKEDILALYWQKGAEEAFEELAPGVFVEFDRKGKMIGLEILNASRIFRPAIKLMTRRVLAAA